MAAIGLVALAGLSACGIEQYRPQPLEPERALSRFVARSLADPALAEFARNQGRADMAWPPARWGWSDLSLVGVFYHPELAVARSRQQVAEAAAAAVGQAAPVGVGLLFEHHDDTVGKPSPWSFGVDAELPVSGTDRRTARVEQFAAQLAMARFDALATERQVQIRILRRFIDLFAARSDSALLGESAIANGEILAMLTKRLDLGSAGAAEVASARQRWLASEQASSEGALRDSDTFVALADALGITTAALRGAELAFDGYEDPMHLHRQIPAGSGDDLRAQALRDRADLQSLLAEYAAAEATVKLEVARQFPELSLKPGYLWDQADNRWSLALGWLVPPSLGNRPAIGEAEAKRQLIAQRFMARQAAVVAEIDGALLRNRLAEEALMRSRLLVDAALAGEVRSRRGYEVGAADRSELIASRLERVAAQRAELAQRVALLQAHADLEAALQVSQDMPNPLVLHSDQNVGKATRQ